MRRAVVALCSILTVALAASASAQTAAVRVAWDANTETDIAGYRLHYGTSSGKYTAVVDVGNRTDHSLPGLAEGRAYYVAVQAYNKAGITSDLSGEIVVHPIADRILLGQGQHPEGEGGRFAVHGGPGSAYAHSRWAQLPWPVYNNAGGSVRLATGDVDGDGADEVVLGLGPGGNGYAAVLDDAAHGYSLIAWLRVHWDAYNAANGEVFPSVGDLDGDGRGEIVLGLGQGGKGWHQIFDDASASFAHMHWGRIHWEKYNADNGTTHPAVGDLDGDGLAEIVVGLGAGGNGWLQVFDNARTGFAHRQWLQVHWSQYNAANGTTFPAVGDVDGDGRGEVVVGLGHGSSGYVQIFDDARTAFTHMKWDQVSWPNYNAHSGETHPAVGNVDGDAAMEVVFGLGEFAGNGGWFEIRDDATTDFVHRAWRNIEWDAFKTYGGALFPAIASR